jgi:hypothetical protein
MRCHILSHGIFSFVSEKLYIIMYVCLKIAIINKQFLKIYGRRTRV